MEDLQEMWGGGRQHTQRRRREGVRKQKKKGKPKQHHLTPGTDSCKCSDCLGAQKSWEAEVQFGLVLLDPSQTTTWFKWPLGDFPYQLCDGCTAGTVNVIVLFYTLTLLSPSYISLEQG